MVHLLICICICIYDSKHKLYVRRVDGKEKNNPALQVKELQTVLAIR